MSRLPSSSSSSPSQSSRVLLYPESELEQAQQHSRSPSGSGSSTVSLSPIPSSRSPLRPSAAAVSSSPSSSFSTSTFSPSFASRSPGFLSSSTLTDVDDAALAVAAAAEVEAEELTRQSLSGSRSASPRPRHSVLNSAGGESGGDGLLSSASLSPSSAASGGIYTRGLPGLSAVSSQLEQPSALLATADPCSVSASGVDPDVAAIINSTRLLAAQAAQSALVLPPSPSSASPSSPSSSSLEQSAVVHSAGLLQLSQRLQELRHPLWRRLQLSVGAASGQMKAGDSAGCVLSCQRALDCLDSWPTLSSLPEKEAMMRVFRSFKLSVQSSDPLHCRLLYVEFFLTLSALLAARHADWSAALQHSAQKGLRALPQEAIRSMTKITQLLFTGGLSRPPSAYRRGGRDGAAPAAGGHHKGKSLSALMSMAREREEEQPAMVDESEQEVELAMRLLRARTMAETGRKAEEADGEEKRLTAEDVASLYLLLGVERAVSADDRRGDAALGRQSVREKAIRLTASSQSSQLRLALQQLLRPAASRPALAASHSASPSLSSPSVRAASGVPSLSPVSASPGSASSAGLSAPSSVQRQLKFHASSSAQARPLSLQPSGSGHLRSASTASPLLPGQRGSSSGSSARPASGQPLAVSPSSPSAPPSAPSPAVLAQVDSMRDCVKNNARDESATTVTASP